MGVAGFATGPLRELMQLPFSRIFAFGSAIAAPLVVVAALIVRRPRVVDLHPPKTRRAIARRFSSVDAALMRAPRPEKLLPIPME